MPAHLPRPLRALAAIVLLALPLAASAAPPGAGGGVPLATPSYSEDELRLIHEEAVATGGMTYSFYILASDEQALLEESVARLRDGGSLKQFPGMELRRQQAFALPVPIRAQLRNLLRGERSPVFALDKRRWAIVELEGIDTTTPVPIFESLRQSLPKLVSSGAIAEPRQLAGDPLLAQRRAMNRAQTTAEFDRLPPGFDIDLPLSSGLTLLQRALVRDDAAMVTATLTRAANGNLCLMRNCPLHLALRSKTQAPAYVRQLLAAGARPDQVSAPGEDTALTAASVLGLTEVVRALLAAGADRQGAGGPHTPLGVAAYAGHREVVQLLLDKGADPLFRKPEAGGGFATPMGNALAGGKADMVALLRAALRKQAATRAPSRYTLWFEQDGEIFPVENNRVSLRRKPFALHVQMPAGSELRLEASTSTRLFDEYRAGPEAPLYQLARRLDEPRDGSARTLLVSDFAARAADPARHGAVHAWSAGAGRRDFSRSARGARGASLVREVDALVLDRASGRSTVPVAKSTLREFALLVGIGADYNTSTGDLLNARRLRVVFDRPDPPPPGRPVAPAAAGGSGPVPPATGAAKAGKPPAAPAR